MTNKFDNFTIRAWQPGDEPAILQAFNSTFPTRRDIDEWNWIYRNPPDGAEIMICLSKQGEVAAHYAATIHRALYQGQEVLVGHMCDTFSLKQYRSVRHRHSNLVSETANKFFETWTGPGKIVFGYGFPNIRNYRLGKLLLKYQTIPQWWRGSYTLSSTGNTDVKSGAITVQEINNFGTAFDRLWERDKGRYDFAVVRDASFLNWRYVDSPRNQYSKYACSPFLSKEVSGYLIFCTQGKLSWLIDFNLPESPTAVATFWREVTSRLRAQGVRQIMSWCSASTPDLQKLKTTGFVDLSTETGMVPVFRSFDPGIESTWAGENFHFTMGDSDHI